MVFHPAQIDEVAIPQVLGNVRKRLLGAFVARGHLESHAAKDMARTPTAGASRSMCTQVQTLCALGGAAPLYDLSVSFSR